MALPLYLAMTDAEMADAALLPPYAGWFSPAGAALPERLPPGAMLILTDRSPVSIPALTDAVRRLQCGSVLLDFEQAPDEQIRKAANTLFQALPCPVAAPPALAGDSDCAVFLPPCPLHVPLAEHLRPWQGRDIWLDVTLRQQVITVTPDGTRFGSPAPADRQDGVFDETLLCRCVTEIAADAVRFILFDTPQTLERKLTEAARLGITRAVGLYQELNEKILPETGRI